MGNRLSVQHPNVHSLAHHRASPALPSSYKPTDQPIPSVHPSFSCVRVQSVYPGAPGAHHKTAQSTRGGKQSKNRIINKTPFPFSGQSRANKQAARRTGGKKSKKEKRKKKKKEGGNRHAWSKPNTHSAPQCKQGEGKKKTKGCKPKKEEVKIGPPTCQSAYLPDLPACRGGMPTAPVSARRKTPFGVCLIQKRRGKESKKGSRRQMNRAAGMKQRKTPATL
ncbi:hypothetical protein IWX90DRAFT_36146 [Phyllosticta citrichinensis]|uniref:Uncharacterized protein n=1 Tax=Phyllosticta citrichinensis TaxID=1130410 RepID=A0ABR1Y7Z5_9PEZI